MSMSLQQQRRRRHEPPSAALAAASQKSSLVAQHRPTAIHPDLRGEHNEKAFVRLYGMLVYTSRQRFQKPALDVAIETPFLVIVGLTNVLTHRSGNQRTGLSEVCA